MINISKFNYKGNTADAEHFIEEVHSMDMFFKHDVDIMSLFSSLLALKFAIINCRPKREILGAIDSVFIDFAEIDFRQSIHEDRAVLSQLVLFLYRLKDDVEGNYIEL